jgi:hypothetical protein
MKVQYIEEKLNKHTESLKKKKSTRNPGNKKSLKSADWNKNRTDIKEENKRILRQKTEKLQKEYEKLCDSIKRPTWELQALKQEKRCKPKVQVIYSTK